MNRSLIILALIALTVSGCATNPVTGRSEFAFVDKSEEIAIGNAQYLPAQQTQGGVYQVDTALTDYIIEVGNRLVTAGNNRLPYEFVVLNNSTPNAWALPGGKIAINRGLLLQLDNEAELAAVLAHEIVHAAARHGAKTIERGLLLQSAVMITSISVSDSDYANYIVDGAQLGVRLLGHRYGRQAELDADYYGIQYMSRVGYDPSAAVSLQQKFVQLSELSAHSKGSEEKSSRWLEGLFASHPPSRERVQKNKESVAMLAGQDSQDWTLGNARYTRKLAYLRTRANAYQMYDQARTLLAEKETGVALARLNSAIEEEPREARFYGLKADILLEQKKYQQAVDLYNDALALDAAYYEYYLGRGLAFLKLGDRRAARADFEQANSLLPTARAANELGNLLLEEGHRAAAKRHFKKVMTTQGELGHRARASYVRIDLEDNPNNYFQTRSSLKDGQLVTQVRNISGQDTSNIKLLFRATINGKGRQAAVSVRVIPAGGQVRVSPGWRLSETDTIGNLNVSVTSAQSD